MKKFIAFFLTALLAVSLLALYPSAEGKESVSVPVTALNTGVTDSALVIFTEKSTFCTDGKLLVNPGTGANLRWTHNYVFAPTSEADVFELVEAKVDFTQVEAASEPTYIDIPAGGFVFALHNDSTTDTDRKATAAQARIDFALLEEGDFVKLENIDIAADTIADGSMPAGAKVTYYAGEVADNSNDETSEETSAQDSSAETSTTADTSSNDETTSATSAQDSSVDDSGDVSEEEGGLGTGAIIGIIAGVVVVIAIIVVVAKKKK